MTQLTAMAIGTIDGYDLLVDLDGRRFYARSVVRTTYNGRPALLIEAYENGQRYQVYAEIPTDETQAEDTRPRAY